MSKYPFLNSFLAVFFLFFVAHLFGNADDTDAIKFKAVSVEVGIDGGVQLLTFSFMM